MWIKQLLYERYSNAIKERLVMNTLNTHSITSLFKSIRALRKAGVWRHDWLSTITRRNTTFSRTGCKLNPAF
jgi:hypothetical protein